MQQASYRPSPTATSVFASPWFQPLNMARLLACEICALASLATSLAAAILFAASCLP